MNAIVLLPDTIFGKQHADLLQHPQGAIRCVVWHKDRKSVRAGHCQAGSDSICPAFAVCAKSCALKCVKYVWTIRPVRPLLAVWT